MSNTDVFFRTATPEEQALISQSEDTRYGRETKSIRILLIAEIIAALAVVVDFIFPVLHLGAIRRLVLLVLDVFLLYITLGSFNITRRQLRKIKGGSYKVQTVTITDVHNEAHGIRSDMIVTFDDGNEGTYTLNTNTTGDMALVQGYSGLLVIIDDEKNVLLTNSYRFYQD